MQGIVGFVVSVASRVHAALHSNSVVMLDNALHDNKNKHLTVNNIILDIRRIR